MILFGRRQARAVAKDLYRAPKEQQGSACGFDQAEFHGPSLPEPSKRF